MDSTTCTLTLLRCLAEVVTEFRQVAQFARNQAALHSVTTSVFPSKAAEPSEYADDGVSLSVALNAELREPIDSETKAIGMSLLLRCAKGEWIVEAEVGRSGQMVGWDQFDEREARAASIELVIEKIPSLVEWLGMKFTQVVGNLPHLPARG